MEIEKLYLKTNKRPKTVRELLKLFYYNSAHGLVKRATTYYDKECTEIQFSGGNRSFRDTLILCKTYFHNVSAKKVFLECLTLYYPNVKPRLLMCNALQDMRFMHEYPDGYVNYLLYRIENYPTAIDRVNEIFNKHFIESKDGAKKTEDFLLNKGNNYYNKHYANK